MLPEETNSDELQRQTELPQTVSIDEQLLRIDVQMIRLEAELSTPEYTALVTDKLHALGFDDEESIPEEVLYAGKSLLGYETPPEGKDLETLRAEFPDLAAIEAELLQTTELQTIRERAAQTLEEKRVVIEQLKTQIPDEVASILCHIDYKRILDQKYFTRQNETVTPNMLVRWHLKFLHRIAGDVKENISEEDLYQQLRNDWRDLKSLQEKPAANASELSEEQLFARSLGEANPMPTEEQIENAKKEIRDSKNAGGWIRAYKEASLVTGDFDGPFEYGESSLIENLDEFVNSDGEIEDFASENPYFLVVAAQKIKEQKETLLKNGVELTPFSEITEDQVNDAYRVFADIPALIQEIKLTNAINDWKGPSLENKGIAEVEVPLPRELLSISISIKNGKFSEEYDDQPELAVLVAHRVQEIRKKLEEQGIPQELTGTPTPEEIESAKEVLYSTRDVLNQIQQYTELSRKYKGSGVSLFNALTNMDACRLNMAVNIQLKANDGIPDRLQDQGAFLVALAREVTREKEELKRKGLIERGVDGIPKEDIGEVDSFDVPISGLGDKTGELCVINNDSIKQYFTRKGSFGVTPKHFTEHLQELSFTSNFDPLKNADGPVDIPRDKVDDIANEMRKQLAKTLVHEMFEGVVLNLSLDELQKWDDVVKAEPQSVTMYERMLILNGDEELARKESLCESGAMFTTEPYALWVVSQKRFEYMLDLKCSYLPEETRQTVRQEYLSEMKVIDEQVAGRKRELRKTLTKHEKVNKKQLKLLEEGGVSTMGQYKLKDMNPTTGKIVGDIEVNYTPYIHLAQIK